MLLDLTCPSCGRTQRATDAVFGKVVLCPWCGGGFPVSPPAEPWPAEPDRTRQVGDSAARTGERQPTRATRPSRGGLPPWAYALLGGAAALILAGSFILIRSPDVAGPGRSPAPGTESSSAAAVGPTLSTAQIVARCEPSVALIKGKVSSGTGFLIRPDLLATNAHVTDDEFLTDLEVRFPSATAGRCGPFRAELLYEDPRRDLALLAVRSGLPALELARSYRFLKGEDVIVIGNPGLGDEAVLENAVSRGVMSSRAVIDGQDYLQMSIAINPGNSGGPILDPAGRVVGVATLKSSKAESLGFGIPVEELHASLIRLDLQPDPAHAATISRHRARTAFRMLTGAGALYAIALRIRAGVLARVPDLGPGTDLLPTQAARTIDAMLTRLERRQLSRVDDELAALSSDAALTAVARRNYRDLASNHRAMRDLYLHPSRPAEVYASRAGQLKGLHLQLVNDLRRELGFQVPREQLAILESAPTIEPPPDALARVVPGSAWPGLRPFGVEPPPVPMGPFFGPRGPGGFSPAREAHARALSLHRKIQEDLRERMRAMQPRLGP
jgi:S1-C subfamily serine protease